MAKLVRGAIIIIVTGGCTTLSSQLENRSFIAELNGFDIH